MYPDYGDLPGTWAQADADLTSLQSITVGNFGYTTSLSSHAYIRTVEFKSKFQKVSYIYSITNLSIFNIYIAFHVLKCYKFAPHENFPFTLLLTKYLALVL